MKRIFYLGYYDTSENKTENRNFVLAATNKMTYIIEAMEKAGYSVEVISASQTKNRRDYPAKTVAIGENSRLRLFKTLPWGNKFKRVLSLIYTKSQYRKYILKTLSKEDTLIAYHSVPYAEFLAKAKKKIGFRLILEVEEIYADVNGNENDRKKEYKLFKAADAYIFPTKMLDDKLNTESKPSVIIHGTYKVEPDRKVNFNDDKIHVVYAGTFDPRKGGDIAAAAAEFLDDKYHIHLLGFGTKEDKEYLLSKIQRVSELSTSKVTFEGLLSGEDYIRFIQSCHIGLSTQNPKAAFNGTSFPSKILSYMSNGLRVVSISIPSIVNSAVGNEIIYYDEQSPEKLAKAIQAVDFSVNSDSREIIKRLDAEFVKEIGEMLNV